MAFFNILVAFINGYVLTLKFCHDLFYAIYILYELILYTLNIRLIVLCGMAGNGEEIIRKNLGANEDLSFLNWVSDHIMCCVVLCCDELFPNSFLFSFSLFSFLFHHSSFRFFFLYFSTVILFSFISTSFNFFLQHLLYSIVFLLPLVLFLRF